MGTTVAPEELRIEKPIASRTYIWYVVGVMTLAYVFSFIDRQIFGILVTPVRRDLHISDTEVSFLMGFSFVVFYTFFGIPLGRISDIYSRRWIIALGMITWSVFTTGCGFAQSFFQMLMLRMGVGVGEAALSPAAYSLITDYVPRRHLALAISIYGTGIYLGSGLSYVLGGIVVGKVSTQSMLTLPIIGMIRSWQLIFFEVGIPGMLLAFLLFTVREPKHRTAQQSNLPMRDVFAYIFKNKRTVLLHNTGFGFLAMSTYAAQGWIATYYIRHFHWSVKQTGLVYGVMTMIFSCIGLFSAGRMADYLRLRGRPNANLIIGVWLGVLSVPVALLLYTAPSALWATVWLAPSCALAAAPWGVGPAAIQQMMPPTMRGQASGIYLFIINLIGLGAGPTAVALCTQYAFKNDNMVQYSLLLVTVFACIPSAFLLYAAAKSYLHTLENLRLWTAHQNIGESAS